MILKKDFFPYLNTSAFCLLKRWNCYTFLIIYGRLPFSHYKKELKKTEKIRNRIFSDTKEIIRKIIRNFQKSFYFLHFLPVNCLFLKICPVHCLKLILRII